jgi:outer membrane protein W
MKKGRKQMKKFLAVFLVVSLVFGAVAFCGVTDKVEKLISTNQSNLERTYYPRDQRPNQLAIKVGPPLFLGAEYSYNIMPALAINLGVGTLAPGMATDLGLTYYILPTTFSPYVTAGINYYGDFTRSITAGNIGVGVDVALDNTMTIQLGLDWVKSIADTGAPFKNAVFSGDVNWFNITGGIGYRF